jgi:hypothetical protein
MKYTQLLPASLTIALLVFIVPTQVKSQGFSSPSRVSGNFQLDAQYYRSDTLIGAPEVGEKLLMNAFTNLLYTQGDFTAGLRFESYLNPISGYDPRLEGTGMPYRFISYKTGDFEITAGNFYEQFGNGLILRTYEDWNLGIDNSLDGVRVKFNPAQGIALKGVYGKQRYFWDKSPGIIRGFDADFSVNDLIKPLSESSTRIFAGAGIVSKYQKDEFIIADPGFRLDLPENVSAFAGRFNISTTMFNFTGEYAHKINDPSSINNFIYKTGQSLYLTGTYFRPGLSVMLSAKHTDNMSFKSRRTEASSALDINFLPPLTKQHSYNLSGMYPYATQPNGEVAYQGQVIYTIKRNTKAGGPYGTFITANYSMVHALNRKPVNDTVIGQRGTLGYEAGLFDASDEKYFSDFNIEISRRINRNLKISLQYLNLFYNIAVIEGHPGEPDVKANIGIADIQYKLTPTKTLRFELQHSSTKQDKGDWASALVEYTVAPKWFFSIGDQYNYGNSDKDKRLHYYNASMGYTHQSSRIAFTWGRQREGIVCVGGVCRYVPASSGLMLTITSSF